MTVISAQDMNVLPSNGWRGYYAQSIIQEGTRLLWQTIYPAGFRGGDSPGLCELGLPGNKVLYVDMTLRFSQNFQGHLTHVNKMLHLWVGGSNRLFLVGLASGVTDPILCGVGLQGVSSPYGSSAQVVPNLVPDAQFARGQWHRLEMVADAYVGTVDLWLDSLHVTSLKGISFGSASASFSVAKLDPTWGGLGDTVQQAMNFSVDRIYTSGK